MSTWQPWSLRTAVGERSAGRAQIQRAQQRIAESEPAIRAWVEFDDAALKATPVSGPLAGVPIGIKDIIDVAGLPTKCGSALRVNTPPATRDAEIVTLWRRTGAVPLGKTVTTEFAYFAPGPTHNPANVAHTPGGSSSGSAAAVAAGHVPLAIGSQTAGSVTRPAAYCGVASLVVTRGRFSLDGVAGLSPSCDSHGFFTATVSDLALAWSAVSRAADVGLEALAPPRLAMWNATSLGVVTAEMRIALQEVSARLVQAGAYIVPLNHEATIANLTHAHPIVMAAEASVARQLESAQSAWHGPESMSRAMAELLTTGGNTAYVDLEAAHGVISDANSVLTSVFDHVDVIIGPAAPGSAPLGQATTGDPVLSRAWQALGWPTINVPGLRSMQGLPLGIQIVGPHGGESRALRAALWVEGVLNELGS